MYPSAEFLDIPMQWKYAKIVLLQLSKKCIRQPVIVIRDLKLHGTVMKRRRAMVKFLFK